MKFTKPDNALVHGFFRTVRAEDRGANLITLDVEYNESPSTYLAVERVLRVFLKTPAKTHIESEFVERGSIMVEIGKKDIVDRDFLSMEPFDRNCSFRAVDFSYGKHIKDSLINDLLQRTFKLVNEGHLKPIHPITIYSFADTPSSFAYMRSGKHIGKIVIGDHDEIKVNVPVRPPPSKIALEDQVSYVIVGGLKGLCGSLAIYLAKHGAKNIVAMSRSGISDERSQKVVMNCNALGCQVQEAAVDVTSLKGVRKAFRVSKYPVAGIIQGAMVLRVSNVFYHYTAAANTHRINLMK